MEVYAHDPARRRGPLQLLSPLVLLVGFVFVFFGLVASASLPVSAYENRLIVSAFLKHIGLRWTLAAVATILVGLWIGRRSLLVGWNTLESGRELRILIAVAVVALAWPLSTLPFNYLASQAHIFDRILVVLLAATVVYRPFMVFPFLFVCAPMIWEGAAPIGVYTWEFHGMPLRVLTLFGVWFLLGSAMGARRASDFVFVLFCMIAGHYWTPGVHKLLSGWLFDNDVYYFLPATYANGWLGFVAPETIERITRWLIPLNIPMKLFAVTIEWASLLILVGRRWTQSIFLVGFILFHAATFVLSGICLWQWALIEMTVLILLWRRDVFSNVTIMFTRWYILGSVVVIGLTPLWLRSASLFWYDSPVNYICRFDAIDRNGHRSSLPPQFFAPFDIQFTFNGFAYLVADQPLLRVTFGAGQKHASNTLKRAKDAAEVFAIEAELGKIRYNEERAERLQDVLRRIATNYNAHPERRTWSRRLSPLPGLVTVPDRDTFAVPGAIARIEVVHVTTFFDGENYRVIRRIPVLSMNVENDSESGVR